MAPANSHSAMAKAAKKKTRDISSVITTNTSLFNKLPKKVREQIFTPLLQLTSWSMSFPSLIQALRQEPVLYFEALDLLYRKNTFNLYARTEKGFFLSSPSVLSKIRHLHVEVDKYLIHPPEFNPTEAWLRGAVIDCTGLERVIVHCKSHAFSSEEIIADFIRKFPAYLAAFKVSKSLELVLPYKPILAAGYINYLSQHVTDLIVQRNFEDMDSVLGVKAKLIYCCRLDPHDENFNNFVDCDVYKWKAKKGKEVDFSKIEYNERWAEHLKACLREVDSDDTSEEENDDEADHKHKDESYQEEGDSVALYKSKDDSSTGGVNLAQAQATVDAIFADFQSSGVDFTAFGDGDVDLTLYDPAHADLDLYLYDPADYGYGDDEADGRYENHDF